MKPFLVLALSCAALCFGQKSGPPIYSVVSTEHGVVQTLREKIEPSDCDDYMFVLLRLSVRLGFTVKVDEYHGFIRLSVQDSITHEVFKTVWVEKESDK